MSKYIRNRPKLGPICPKCGEKAKAVNAKFGKLHECCGLMSWNYKPLVTPKTLSARRMAHISFDRLWKHIDGVSRADAYRMLAQYLQINKDECHISMFDYDQCLKTSDFGDKLFKSLREALKTVEEGVNDVVSEDNRFSERTSRGSNP